MSSPFEVRRGFWWAALVPCLLASQAGAHAFTPSLLELSELEEGRVEVIFKTPPPGEDTPGPVTPVLPGECRRVEPAQSTIWGGGRLMRVVLACPSGLAGNTVGVERLADETQEVIARVALADGTSLSRILRQGRETFEIPARPSTTDTLRAYLLLGFEHILAGYDHLIFVLGLILLIASKRDLAWTVTSFTVAHSVTLTLSALGWVRLPQGPVEVVIALSIVFLAVEVSRGGGGAGKAPWAVAFGFGLLHGFGFAGALSEAGVPSVDLPLALLSFNVGIELGQLAFVAAVLGLVAAIRGLWRSAHTLGPAVRALAAQGIGALGTYWCLVRFFGA